MWGMLRVKEIEVVEDEVVDEPTLAVPRGLPPVADNEEVKDCPFGRVVTVTTWAEDEDQTEEGQP